MNETLQTRLQTLEELSAHRESDLRDLSDMVAQQWRRIEALERELSRTKDRLVSLEDEIADAPAAQHKPPHW